MFVENLCSPDSLPLIMTIKNSATNPTMRMALEPMSAILNSPLRSVT